MLLSRAYSKKKRPLMAPQQQPLVPADALPPTPLCKDFDVRRRDGDGVDDDHDGDGDVDDDDEPPETLHRSRRRFVRGGMTTYEQWISKNAMGRRFIRRSQTQPMESAPASQTASPHEPSPSPSAPSTASAATAAATEDGTTVGTPAIEHENPQPAVSSLSRALKEVMTSKPTVLKAIVDPSVGPARSTRAFVVEQSPEGDYFIASRHIPSTRIKDDSFIEAHQVHTAEAGATAASRNEFRGRHAAAALSRRSEMDFTYRDRWGAAAAVTSTSSREPTSPPPAPPPRSMPISGVASIKNRSRTRASNLSAGDIPAVTPATTRTRAPIRRSLSTGATDSYATRDHDGHVTSPASGRPRQESTAMLLGGTPDVDHLPLLDGSEETAPGRTHSVDKGPMTLDELFGAAEPAPARKAHSRPLRKQGSNESVKRSHSREVPKKEDDDEDEDESLFSMSFRNVRDEIDLLTRKKSLSLEATEEPEKPMVASESEEDDINGFSSPDERPTEDFGVYEEEEPENRPSNIAEFLGGFKGRNSLGRNSLGRNSLGRNSLGRNSLGRNSDFASRAARSLRNRKSTASAAPKVSSELSRRLREARARIPIDCLDEPKRTKKRRGFLSQQKRVRFDMTRYCREFEVIEPEPSDDDMQEWQQRASELDEDEYSDESDEYEGDFGIPIPSHMPTIANSVYQDDDWRLNNVVVPIEDKRVSVSRRSEGNQMQVFM